MIDRIPGCTTAVNVLTHLDTYARTIQIANVGNLYSRVIDGATKYVVKPLYDRASASPYWAAGIAAFLLWMVFDRKPSASSQTQSKLPNGNTPPSPFKPKLTSASSQTNAGGGLNPPPPPVTKLASAASSSSAQQQPNSSAATTDASASSSSSTSTPLPNNPPPADSSSSSSAVAAASSSSSTAEDQVAGSVAPLHSQQQAPVV